MKPKNKKALDIAIHLATWTDNLDEIVQVLAILVRIFCWRTYEEVRRAKSGENLNDIQERIFRVGKARREINARKNLAKRTEYL